jgi:hypothetical protein
MGTDGENMGTDGTFTSCLKNYAAEVRPLCLQSATGFLDRHFRITFASQAARYLYKRVHT